ncbi:g1262 [Coccomyxa elongata]
MAPTADRRRNNLELLHIGFNQDTTCFACGTNSGFRVYNCDPFKETFRRDFNNAGIGVVEMLFRCNILALVGGGAAPRFSPNKVMIWDDHQGRCIGELSFRSQVRAVRLRRDKIVVALEHKVLMYNFADLRLEHSTETLSNPNGLVALSPCPEHNVLACPGLHCGQVRVELYDVRRTKFIQAHTSALACIALSQDGKMLATASERGTLVRIHSTTEGTKLQELRRGADPACIYSIAFSKGDRPHWLALSSDKGTVHVFSLDQRQPSPEAGAAAINDAGSLRNPVSPFSFVSAIFPVSYFASERSFAQYRLPEDVRSTVGFGPQPNTLVIVSASGSFYTAAFDEHKGGACQQLSFCKFLELDQED